MIVQRITSKRMARTALEAAIDFVIGLAVLCTLVFALQGCNTMEGAGEDLEEAGEEIEEAAEEIEDDLDD